MTTKYPPLLIKANTQEAIFLALSKAFETINFDILFDKPDYYGFRGVVIDWIEIISPSGPLARGYSLMRP